MAEPTSPAHICSLIFTVLICIMCILILFLLTWVCYSNYMVIYKPYIGLSGTEQPLSLLQSLKLLSYLRSSLR
ncbi:OrNV_orf63-like [Fopius arisanus]|nr:OrNV_orf63-like [Fopius arisanus]